MFFPSLKEVGYPGIVGCFWKVIDVNMLKTDRILFQGVHQIDFLYEHRLYDFFLVLSLRRLVCTSFYQVWGNLNIYHIQGKITECWLAETEGIFS